MMMLMRAQRKITPPTTPPAMAPVLDLDLGWGEGVEVADVGITRDAVRGVAEAVVAKYTDKSRMAKPAAGVVTVACPSVLSSR